jgi:hypothetical protein
MIEYEIELGEFQWECINARKAARSACIEQKVVRIVNGNCYYEGKRIFDMTPQEELFSKFFNHEKVVVKDMDLLTLRAHREELAKIAFEARARLTAVDDEEKQRTKKERGKGFTRSVQTDDVTSDAINTIKERQGRLTKMEKAYQGLIDMGVSPEDAQRMTSNSAIADLRAKKDGVKPAIEFPSTPAIDIKSDVKSEPENPKEFINPFAKKG